MADYNLGTAQGEIVLDFDESGVEKANSAVGNLAKGLGKFALGAVGAVAAVTTVVGGLALKGGISRALNIQDAQEKLKGLGHSTQDIQTIMNSALASVKGTAFGLDEAAGVAATAVAAGIKPGQELTKYLTLTADAATIAGTNLGDMGAILNKAVTSGKVYTDTLNQLSDRGIPVFQYLAKEYGVSQAKLSEMVSAGEVDSDHLRAALEKNLGGAALSSGATARGAFKNVQAALSRLGVGFVSGAVTEAPNLFTSISNAVDRLTKALAPVSAQVNTFVSGAMARLATAIDGINFDTVVAKISSGVKRAQDIVTGMAAFFQSAYAKIKAASSGNNGLTVDTSGLSTGLATIQGIVQPLGPLFVKLAQGIGQISGSVGDVISSGLPVVAILLQDFAGVLQTLGEHPKVLAAAVIALAGAFVIYRANQVVATAATVASIPYHYAQVAATLLSARANNNLANSNRLLAGQTELGTVATIQNNVAQRASALAAVFSGVKQKALAVATGVATAAQWLFNAALDANPIGIIIIAIAALVAGLIYFFTQTKLGQAVFKVLVAAITAAISTIKAVFTTVFTAIGAFLSTFWNGLVALASPFINFISGILGPIIQAVIGGIITYFQTWALVISTVVNAIIGFLTPFVNYFNTYMVPLIQAAIGLVVAIFQYLLSVANFVFGAIASFIGGVVSALVGAVVAYFTNMYNGIVAVLNAVRSFFSTVFGAIASFVSGVVSRIVAVAVALFSPIIARIAAILNAVFSTVSGIFNRIVSIVSSLVGRAVSVAVSVFSPIVSRIGSILGGLYNAVQGPFNKVYNFITSLKDKVIGFFGGAGKWLLEAGKHIIQGLIDGVTSMITGLTDKLKSITNLIPKSKGPEKVDKVLLFDNGTMIMQSLINGIAGKVPMLTSLLGNLTNQIPSMAQVPQGAIIRPGAANSATAGNKTVNNNVVVNNADNPDLWLRAVQRELDGDV